MPIYNNEDFNMYYDDLGSGIPIVFIHPPGMGRKVFLFQTSLQEQFRVIFPDLSGHGDSVGTHLDISIESYAIEIKLLLDHLQISKSVICGYSAGGIIAQEFSLTFPERTSATILVSSYPKVQSLVLKDEHLIGMFLVKKFPHFLAKCIASSHTNRKDISKVFFDHMIKANKETWFQYYEKTLAYSCVERLTQLKSPLLLVYGSKDFANQHIRSYRDIPHQLKVVEKVSHQVLTKKWEIFNRLVTDFISETVH
ncbi:alpha/beta hydrolase [Robertmurraya massiliosenegalensis]|uniref:alpha/beta fold hydrolase n=1 Tax=Robertmurraya TaxID=2837507 RepID=UPI0039A5C6B7